MRNGDSDKDGVYDVRVTVSRVSSCLQELDTKQARNVNKVVNFIEREMI